MFLAALLPVPDVYAVALEPEFSSGHRDDQGRSYWADEATAAERLYPDLDPELQRWAFPQLRRQAPLTAHEQLPDGPTAYVATLRDVASARNGSSLRRATSSASSRSSSTRALPDAHAPGGAGGRAGAARVSR